MDTRIKLFLFILINSMVIGLKPFMLSLMCFASVWFFAIYMKQYNLAKKYLIFYACVAIIERLCNFIPQPLSGIVSIFTLFIRVMIPIVFFASVFIATTKVSELIAAMYFMKIPKSITITFTMTLRFFPTFSEEIKSVYDAMKLRNLAFTAKNILTKPLLIFEALLVPIVMRSATIAEELSASAITRGIDSPEKRSSFVKLKVQKRDIGILVIFLLIAVALFTAKYKMYGRI